MRRWRKRTPWLPVSTVRKEAGYVYVGLVPGKIQAWREVNELTDERTLMIGGKWLP